jgi:type I restriction enzyme S subunit
MDKHYPPSRWDKVSLGELEKGGRLLMRSGFPCGDNNEQRTGVPQLRPMNVDEFCEIDLSHVKYIETRRDLSNYWLYTDDVVFNNTNSRSLVGKTAVWLNESRKYVLSNHMTFLRLRDRKALDSHFVSFCIYFLWRSGYFEQMRQQHVNQASISLNRLRAIEIPLPSLTEQRSIVRLLTSVQMAKNNRRRELELELERKAALMQHLFTFGTRDEPTKQTQIGKIPDSWQVVQLKEVSECLDHLRVPVKSSERSQRPGIVPYYGASGQAGWIDEYLFDEELLLVAEDGENLHSRKLPIAYTIQGKSWVNNHAHVLRIIGVNQFFLEYYLDLSDISPYLSGTTRPKLNKSQLMDIELPKPRISEQIEIVTLLRSCDAKISALNLEISLLAELFQAMLEELMAGKLSAKPLTEVAAT